MPGKEDKKKNPTTKEYKSLKRKHLNDFLCSNDYLELIIGTTRDIFVDNA